MAKVLIVDDSRTSRRIMRSLLEENGHEVAGEASNGQEAVELAERLDVDVATMDITMPIMDGIEALRNIKSKNSKIKVIMVTAAGQNDKVMEAIKLGASEFLTKPFDPEKVLQAIERITI